MRNYAKFVIIFLFLALTSACTWPSADILFIIDGTLSLDQFQFQKELSFITQCLSNIKISQDDSQLAMAQFTPKGKQEFSLSEVKTNAEAKLAVEQVSFVPCDLLSDGGRCRPRASINSLAGEALQTGNRKWLPDVVVVISSTKYRLPETLPTETLFSPQSPLHIFYIIIGGPSPDEAHFEPSATSIRLNAIDFNALERLVVPLCETVNSFVAGGAEHAVFGSTCWLVIGILAAILLLCLLFLGYAVYAYRQESKTLSYKLKEMEKTLRAQNEFFTAKLHAQMEEQIKLGEKHAEELRKHNETIQAHQMELQRQQQLSAVPTVPAPQPQPIIIPYLHPNAGVTQQPAIVRSAASDPVFVYGHSNEGTRQRHIEGRYDQGRGDVKVKRDSIASSGGSGRNGGHDGRIDRRGKPNGHGGLNMESTDGRLSKREEELLSRLDKLEETLTKQEKAKEENHGSEENQHDHQSSGAADHQSSDQHTSSEEHRQHYLKHRNPELTVWPTDPHSITEEDSSDTATDDSGYAAQGGKLSHSHPARHLPPIDLLFLVDSSSSIGISNFEAIKTCISNVLEDVDIGPGRSRIALIQYALQPSVVFGFDKYYSQKSVQRGVERMSYTGGATMLSKALSFAAGVLYKEQNMRDIKKRKHKLMPTPRHDRLQVLCLVSDGAADDNIDKAAAYLHEKLQVKVMAMITRSFNKDKLIPITRYEGSIFVMDQKESISIWLWRHQRMWAENYAAYIEREKSMPLSLKHSQRKSHRTAEQQSKSPQSI